jgi:hypothetical protein
MRPDQQWIPGCEGRPHGRTVEMTKGGVVKTLSALLAALVALVVVVSAASEPAERSSSSVVPPVSAFLPKGMFGPRQLVFFGYVKSLTRSGGRYSARVDPTFMLTGITASTAAVEDGVLRPGEPVPNDYYDRNESARQLKYIVPANAHVTVIVNRGEGPRSEVVPVSEFAQIVKGKNPRHRPGLWGPGSGFWIRAQGDTALALDQAYRP